MVLRLLMTSTAAIVMTGEQTVVSGTTSYCTAY